MYVESYEHFLGEDFLGAGAGDGDDQGEWLLAGKFLHRQGKLSEITWGDGREIYTGAADASHIVVGNGQDRTFQTGGGGIGDGEADRNIAGKMSASCLQILA